MTQRIKCGPLPYKCSAASGWFRQPCPIGQKDELFSRNCQLHAGALLHVLSMCHDTVLAESTPTSDVEVYLLTLARDCQSLRTSRVSSTRLIAKISECCRCENAFYRFYCNCWLPSASGVSGVAEWPHNVQYVTLFGCSPRSIVEPSCQAQGTTTTERCNPASQEATGAARRKPTARRGLANRGRRFLICNPCSRVRS